MEKHINRVRMMLQYGVSKEEIREALSKEGLDAAESFLVYCAAKQLNN